MSSLADISAINCYLRLSHTPSHTQSLQFTPRADCDNLVKLSSRTDSANSLLKNWTKTANRFANIARNSARKTEPVNTVASDYVMSWCLATSSQRVLLRRHRVYNCVALEMLVVPCDVIATLCSNARCGSVRDGTEKTPLPLLLRSVYSVARCLEAVA
jgi:hypothetical protein